MENSILISSRVINTIKSLPAVEREAIAFALAAEMILDKDPDDSLNNFQSVLYSMVRFYVKHDTERLNRLFADTRYTLS